SPRLMRSAPQTSHFPRRCCSSSVNTAPHAGKPMKKMLRTLFIPALLLGLAATGPAAEPGRTPAGGLNLEREAELAQRHDGFLGALAPENLAKPRPKPPFDMTGTWFVNLRRSFQDFRFGPPYPEFYEPGQTALREAEEARRQGVPYRD